MLSGSARRRWRQNLGRQPLLVADLAAVVEADELFAAIGIFQPWIFTAFAAGWGVAARANEVWFAAAAT